MNAQPRPAPSTGAPRVPVETIETQDVDLDSQAVNVLRSALRKAPVTLLTHYGEPLGLLSTVSADPLVEAPLLPWVAVVDRLPRHHQAVLVRRSRDNWGADHFLGDQPAKIWRWQACWFVKGRTAEELSSTDVIRGCDQDGNNLVPYCWEVFGPGTLFGQDVSHWMPISEP